MLWWKNKATFPGHLHSYVEQAQACKISKMILNLTLFRGILHTSQDRLQCFLIWFKAVNFFPTPSVEPFFIFALELL